MYCCVTRPLDGVLGGAGGRLHRGPTECGWDSISHLRKGVAPYCETRTVTVIYKYISFGISVPLPHI